MAYSKEIAWDDGSGDKIYFSAPASEGDQTVEISSDANAGAERTKTVNFNASGVSPQPLQIVQLAGGVIDFDAWLHDGDTHLWINILTDYHLEQKLRLRMIGTIDWGDGTSVESINVTSYTTKTHTYSKKGKYRIDLHPTSGTFYLGGGTSSYNVMGPRSTEDDWRASVLYQVEVGSSIITNISAYAFYYCFGLQRAWFSKNITTFNSNTFNNCTSLHDVEFEEGSTITTSTLTSNFAYCYSLQRLVGAAFSGGTAISSTYRSDYSIQEITIPATVTSIAANSFNGCYGLKKLFCLPTSAPSVANANAFTGLPSTCSIKVPKGSLSSYQSAGIWSNYSSQMSEAGAIKMTLTRVVSSNKTPMADLNGSYTTTLTPDTGKTLGTVTVKMGGTDITSTAYSAGVVTIASVTGNIEITASAS